MNQRAPELNVSVFGTELTNNSPLVISRNMFSKRNIIVSFISCFTKGETFINNTCSPIHEDSTQSRDWAIK